MCVASRNILILAFDCQKLSWFIRIKTENYFFRLSCIDIKWVLHCRSFVYNIYFWRKPKFEYNAPLVFRGNQSNENAIRWRRNYNLQNFERITLLRANLLRYRERIIYISETKITWKIITQFWHTCQFEFRNSLLKNLPWILLLN